MAMPSTRFSTFHPVHPLDQHLLSLYDKVNFLITPK
jgi:hypothetical protein